MSKDSLPRWATASGVWLTVLLIGIIGWVLQEYKKDLDSTLKELKLITVNHSERLIRIETGNNYSNDDLKAVRSELTRILIELRKQNQN